MNTILNENTKTLLINKSTFISYIKHVENIDDAKTYLNSIRKLHSDATHVVSAYVIGDCGEYGHSNDDGEPSGTAGMPIFDCLKKNELTNCIAIVVRYFGGIKLGAGGLVRAYSSATSQNLLEMTIVPIIKYTRVHLSFSYPYLSEIEKVLNDTIILERSFHTQIDMIVKIPSNILEYIVNDLKNICCGKIEINILA